MNSNDKIVDGITRHHIFVQRYAKGRENEASQYIGRLMNTVINRIEKGNITQISRARLGSFLLDLTQTVRQFNDEHSSSLINQVIEFAKRDSETIGAIVQNAVEAQVALPTANQLESAVFTNIMDLEPSKGYTISSILSEFGDKKARQIEQYIRDGFALGETTDQIASRIRSNEFMMRSQAKALARTVVNHTATQARNTTMKENADILDGYKWIATLDSRTSLVCASRDGIVYDMDDSNPKPPAHFNCRSTITYVVKPEFNLGGDIDVKRPSKGASGTKQVSQGTNYAKWLKRQPASFQDEILGEKKGKLFRRGKVKLENFVDEQGRPLSLDQLEELERRTGSVPNITKRVKPIDIIPKPKPEPEPDKIDDNFFRGLIRSGQSLPKKYKNKFTSEGYAKYLNNHLSDATLKVVMKAPKPILAVDGRRGYYAPGRQMVVASTIDKNKSVFVHEYGHHIDYVLGRGMPLSNGYRAPFSHIDRGFQKAIEADKKALFQDNDDLHDFITKYKDKYFEKYKKTKTSKYTYLRSKLHKTDGDFEGSITDIFDAMSGGIVYEKYGLSGHGISYYRSKEAVSTEIFAQLFSLHNGNSETKRKARKLFPNLFARMDEILKDYIDGKI